MHLTRDIDKVKQYLEEKRQYGIRYAIDYCHQTPAVYTDDDGNISAVVVEVEPKWCYLLYSEDEAKLDEIFHTFLTHHGVYIEALDGRIYDYFHEKFGFELYSRCSVLKYNGKPVESSCPFTLKKLRVKDYKTVKEHYQYPVFLKEIDYCGRNLPNTGLYIDGKLVCWCMVHENGSMGPAFTLPEYRGRGFAAYVTRDLIVKMLAQNMFPYCYVVKGNTASEHVSPKVNFEFTDLDVCYAYRQENRAL